MPFVALKDDGTGTWRASTSLPNGSYAYLFEVKGDADGPAATKRYVIDPTRSAYAACPKESPTFNAAVQNPCSSLAVPTPAPDALHHVTGSVVVGGAPVAGWLVLVERTEDMSHHFFANRLTTAANGAFDFAVAPGKYRVQVQLPDFLTTTDTARDPLARQTLRRALSDAFMVAGDVALDAAEVQYLDYPQMSPTGTSTLPTTFHLSVPAGATSVHVAVYGTNMGKGKRIGDPWFASPGGKKTTATFDGTFTTKAATEMMVAPGETYFWGTSIARPAGNGLSWRGESMPFQIVWN